MIVLYTPAMKTNYMQMKYDKLKVGKRASGLLLALVLGLFSGVAHADWSADSLGEGSGLDRGMAMSSEATLRTAIEQAAQAQQVASSFDYTASAAGSFGSGGIGVMAVSAGSGGEEMED